jgi:hypothetical protein
MTRGQGYLWLLAGLISAAATPANSQNFDAGKSPAQIFESVCADCHRSVRALRSRATTSFLSEHYMTGTAMAAAMVRYLTGGSSSSDPRATLPQAQRPPTRLAPADAVAPYNEVGDPRARLRDSLPTALKEVNRPAVSGEEAAAAEAKEAAPPPKPPPPRNKTGKPGRDIGN